MRKIRFFFLMIGFLAMTGLPSFSAPISHPKAVKAAQQAFSQDQEHLFFASRAFRFLAKNQSLTPNKNSEAATPAPGNLFENSDNPLIPQFQGIQEKTLFLHNLIPFPISRKLLLESGYTDFESPDPKSSQDMHEYAKVLKSSAVGLAYPLTPRLTLSGHYAFVKQVGIGSSLSPYLGATYRFNTTTSLSLGYRQSSEKDSEPETNSKDFHHTSARLQIHF